MLDSVTETIAHFIGQFEILSEEARLRQQYDPFRFEGGRPSELPPDDPRSVHVLPPLNLADFTPDFPTIPIFADWSAGVAAGPAASHYGLAPMRLLHFSYPQHDAQIAAAHFQTRLSIDLPAPETPGSVVVHSSQHATISDNDYLGVGGSGLAFHPASGAESQLALLGYAAEQLSPLSNLAQPSSPGSLATFFDDAKTAFGDFAAAHSCDDGVTVHRGSTLDGVFLNGQPVDAAPVLGDYLPSRTAPDTLFSGSGDGPAFVPGEGRVQVDSGVRLDTGGNMVVNEAHISNIGLGAAVLAVGGDDIELNAICQVTALADHDLVSSYLADWAHGGGVSQTFNIAQFERLAPSHDGSGGSSSQGPFPGFWSVTQMQGDLVFLNWTRQFAFVSDHDVVVASASGVQTSVVMGANAAVNVASLSELGHYYDLVVVGGNVYSANMITQINVLLDNDLVGAVSGFQTLGRGSVSTSDNLQWNSAGILNIGDADRFQPMPAAYRATLDDMSRGQMEVHAGVLSDGAFAGYGAISVLYVSGSIYDLNYIEQHSFLGDNDQVALAMNALAADPTANWSIVTGSNTLANIASITSMDAMGKTYVNGQHYSDAMLVQSGLLPSQSDMQIGGQDPDAIVNEAVAFLTDSPGELPGNHDGLPVTPAPAADHAAQPDGVHALG